MSKDTMYGTVAYLFLAAGFAVAAFLTEPIFWTGFAVFLVAAAMYLTVSYLTQDG